MPVLLVASSEPLAGKSTVAVGLGRRLHDEGHSVALMRLLGDEHAAADAALFASLAFNNSPLQQPVEASAAASAAAQVDVLLVEAPAGDPTETAVALQARVVLVWRYSPAGPPANLCRSLGEALAGLVATYVPTRRLEEIRSALRGAQLPALALIPEDRRLAAPTLDTVTAALEASRGMNGETDRPLDPIAISSISADPGQQYFLRRRPEAAIVRGDKPDQQLAALGAGVSCLILTGGVPPLSYVLDRAEGEGAVILQTRLDTVSAARRVEELYGATSFSGRAKVERAAQLMAGTSTAELLKRSKG